MTILIGMEIKKNYINSKFKIFQIKIKKQYSFILIKKYLSLKKENYWKIIIPKLKNY